MTILPFRILHAASRRRFGLFTGTLLSLAALMPLRAFAFPSILVDVGTGQVLVPHEAFKRWYPASLTKLMLMYVVFTELRSGKLTLATPITMSKHAVSEPPAKLYLKPGASMTLDTALKLLMTKSANDIAMGVAENVGGSEENFVAMMNADARQIGMLDSHFVNPNGLPEDGQYVTARDMALLAATLRRDFPQYAFYFDLEGVQLGKRKIPNFNLLIGRFPGADGMKTGFICASGFNQVSTATRGGRTLLAVAFGTPSLSARAEETAKLLQEGFGEHQRGGPTLRSLQPYGANRQVVADVSDQICTPKAHKARVSERADDGKLKLDPRYLRPMTHDPHYIEVSLLSDGGPAPVQIADVPVPTPRPDNGLPATASAYAPVESGDGAAQSALDTVRGAVPGAPVPAPRP
ncbi:MAG: D-alanyl-D-alanine carboxypeptidase family protein [Pararhizobium sp.]